MDQPSVTTTQTCILLGSQHVYHGRPNMSFSLLEAMMKMPQAFQMHRELTGGNFDDIELQLSCPARSSVLAIFDWNISDCIPSSIILILFFPTAPYLVQSPCVQRAGFSP